MCTSINNMEFILTNYTDYFLAHQTTVLILLIIVTYFFLLLQWRGTYWKRKRVDGPRARLLFGNMFEFITRRKHYGKVYEEIYRKYPGAEYVGIYTLLNEPAILVRSVDMVKEILVKQFQKFHDNAVWIDENKDRLAAKNPFIARGNQWKVTRNQLVSLFTPKKVKSVFPQINEVCKKLEDYISDKLYDHWEAKELCSKYTLEVVASCAYGIEGQTFSNKSSDFSRLVEKLFQPRPFSIIETVALLFSPIIGKLIKYRYVPKNIEEWLTTIITKIITRREITNEPRNDFIQSILDLKNKKGENISELGIIGHCTTCLLEGFETSSTLMAFALYELCMNPQIQKIVQDEIDAVLAKYNGELTYEALMEMAYLENVLLETLRMHPAMYSLSKICTESTELPFQYKHSKNRIQIRRGTCVIIPVLAIHYDPILYPNPNVFDPERFSEENQKKQSRYAFLAFGEGSRMCLGMRFGLAQSKAGLATILSKYKVNLSDKMKIPLEISATTFLLSSKDGIWIKFLKR